MRSTAFVAFASSLFALAAFSCGNGKAPGNPDASTEDAGDGAVTTFSYTPAGCNYTVTPTNDGLSPTGGAFLNLAPDDTAPPSGDITPSLVRVGVGGGTDATAPGYADPTKTAAFTWQTPTATNAAKLKIGTSATSLTTTQTGYSWTTPQGLGTTMMYMHSVHVCGLTPGTTYYYEVGGGPTGSETWSAVQSFTTVPPASQSMTVGVFGDARDTLTTWQLVHERMQQAGVAIQLIPGDIVDIGANGDLWQQWLTAIWKDPNDSSKFLTLGQQMMLPIAGNHEAEAAQFYGNWAIPQGAQYASTYASIDVGNTHFVMIDDDFSALQTDYTQDPANTLLTWLKADLDHANKNRTNVPFIVALSHRGLYSTSNHSTDPDVLAARGVFAPIYDQYSVDLVFNGHDHEYERSKPVKAGNPPSGDPVVGSVDGNNNPVAGTGTTYVICAGAGADPYAVGEITKSYSLKQVAFGNNTPYIGTYSLLTLNGNSLVVNAYGLKASGTDDVIDTITLSH